MLKFDWGTYVSIDLLIQAGVNNIYVYVLHLTLNFHKKATSQIFIDVDIFNKIKFVIMFLFLKRKREEVIIIHALNQPNRWKRYLKAEWKLKNGLKEVLSRSFAIFLGSLRRISYRFLFSNFSFMKNPRQNYESEKK